MLIGWRLPKRRVYARVFLLIASYTFYAFAAHWYATLMALSTTVDYTVGRLLGRTEGPRARKGILLASLVFNLGLLSFFKYYGFFIDTVNAAAGHAVLRATLHIMLPAGISFYTFQSMGYSIDVYRRDLAPARSFLQFATFVSLFPQLIAGPIVRPTVLLPNRRREARRQLPPVWRGDALFMRAAQEGPARGPPRVLRRPDLERPGSYGSVDLWLAMTGFALQIYFDFSGYTDMARGLARMLGMEFTINFDSPYHADSPSDFWKRWHISLSTWLRDYLYIPLGGNRRGKRRTIVEPLPDHVSRRALARRGVQFPRVGRVPRLLARRVPPVEPSLVTNPQMGRRAVMVLLVLASWIPFRMHSLADIGTFLVRGSYMPSMPTAPLALWAYGIVGVGVCALPWNSNAIRWESFGYRRVLAYAALTVVAVLYLNLSSKFIYFAF